MHDKNSLSKIITSITGVIIGLMTIGIPLGYFLISYQYIAGSLVTEAEVNAAIISYAVNLDPSMYEFSQADLNARISSHLREGTGEIRRFRDENNRIFGYPHVAEARTADRRRCV